MKINRKTFFYFYFFPFFIQIEQFDKKNISKDFWVNDDDKRRGGNMYEGKRKTEKPENLFFSFNFLSYKSH